jgi:RimJ/RimL family protein N-acetyltransferase
MQIKLGEYLIRDWSEDDASAIVRYANNRNITMWLRDRFPHPYTVHDAEAFLAAVARQDPRVCFAIATRREAIGGIGLEMGTDVYRMTAELGYWLGEPFWGRGIMSEAVVRFSAWAFEHIELHRIWASVFADNAASVRVLEKAGFEYEGRLRASAFKNGRVLDQFLYARVKDTIR